MPDQNYAFRASVSPCKDCTRRFYGCHNVKLCKPWAEYVAKKKAEKAARDEAVLQHLDESFHYNRYHHPDGRLRRK